MSILLNRVEVRVLGSLVEKDVTTPDYYPLSLNALINACNQKSNRDPVMNLDEDEVRLALRTLGDKGLAGIPRGIDSRVAKFEHKLQEFFNFTRGETAILCVLLLRGAQTPGELRGRTERLFRFEELSDVLSTLQRLMDRETPLVKVLHRQPGTKEARYIHLLSAESEIFAGPSTLQRADSPPAEPDVFAAMQDQITGLQNEVAELKRQMAELKTALGEQTSRISI